MGEEYRAKVFKSGNSLALRLPKALGLKDGTEMIVREERGKYAFEPVNQPKRKFAVDKVWASAEGLSLIAPEDRLFQPRDLLEFPDDDGK